MNMVLNELNYIEATCSLEGLGDKDYVILDLDKRTGYCRIIDIVINSGHELSMFHDSDDGFNFKIGRNILGMVRPGDYIVKEIIFK